MPTATRVFAALTLALLSAALAHFVVTPRLPEWRAPGQMVLVAGGIALVLGWRLFAPRAETLGPVGSASLGVTAAVLSAALTLIALTGWLALRDSMRGRYHGLEGAFDGWVDHIIRDSAPLWTVELLLPLILGGALVGLLAHMVGRYAR